MYVCIYIVVCVFYQEKNIYFDTGKHRLMLLKNLKLVKGSLLSLSGPSVT